MVQLKLWKMKITKFNIVLFSSFILLLSQNLFAQPAFSKNNIISNLDVVKKIVIDDLDGDGDLDVIAAASDANSPFRHVVWLQNNGSMGFSPITISNSFPGCRAVATGDFDNDGDLDVIACNTGASAATWWVNDGTPSGPNWSSNTLSGAGDSMYSVTVVDLDGDTDDDILLSFLQGDNVGWYENTGSGSFTYHNIEASYNGAVDLVAARIDSDSDLDLLGAAFYGDLISWWSQTTTGNFSSKIDIDTGFRTPNSVIAGDMDGDGDNDVLAAGHLDTSAVVWWENTGNGSFGSGQIIEPDYEYARNAVFQDVDSDGDMDVVACADAIGDVNWYENDGNENFTKRFINNNFNIAYNVQSLDFDGDGDIDVIASAEGDDEIAWWENDGAESHFTAAGDPDTIFFFSGEVAIDFSGGGDGDTRVFYNANLNQNRTSLNPGIDHLAARGFFTIYTQKPNAAGEVIFDFSLVSDWSPYNNTSTLRICRWSDSNNRWEIAGTNQNLAGTEITVQGLTQDSLSAFSKWTIGSTNEDNPLPVSLTSFMATPAKRNIQISWQTASEVNNLGFELWRKTGNSEYSLMESYKENPDLEGLGNSSLGKNYQYIDSDVTYGQTYYYQLADISYNGQKTTHEALTIHYINSDLHKLENTLLPHDLNLDQNFPNPFNGATRIRFSVPEENSGQSLQLLVFNDLGQKIKTLYDNNLAAGQYEMAWDGTTDAGRPVSSGMYIYMLRSGSNELIKRMMYVK